MLSGNVGQRNYHPMQRNDNLESTLGILHDGDPFFVVVVDGVMPCQFDFALLVRT